MVYSVVETFENEKSMITAVPTIWIKADVLWWPPQTKVSEYRKKLSIPTINWKEVKITRFIHKNIGKIKKIYII